MTQIKIKSQLLSEKKNLLIIFASKPDDTKLYNNIPTIKDIAPKPSIYINTQSDFHVNLKKK